MIKLFVERSASISLVVLCIITFGLITYVSLPRESNPEVKIPVVMVSTPYIGVSPKDVESLVTIPLENELSGVKDLKKMSSTSAEGVSIISLEFEPEVVIEEVMQLVRDRVSRAKTKLPPDIEEPDIREINFADMPVIIIALGGDVDEELLKKYGEKLEDEFKSISGVLDAKLTGGRTREIRVRINPHRLHHYSLSMKDVIDAISAENVNIPGGNVSAGSANYLLRVPGEFVEPREIAGVAIKRVGDRPVFVRDVATVVDGFADRASYSRMNGKASVSIGVSKRTGANILEVVDEVKAIAEAQSKTWAEGVSYRALSDQSRFVRDMVNELENNIITALLLVVSVIFLFMGFRNSLFIAVAIPLSMLLGMIFISLFDMTLNMVVLFSLILALGMLVDNAIVLVENIYRHVEEGVDLKTASIVGTKEVAIPVAASTLTTVAAFAPLMFWTGIMGQFMGYLPKTVVIVLMSSLLVAIAFLPVFTAKLMKKAKATKAKLGEAGHSYGPVMRAYRQLLTMAIRHRYVAAGLVTAVLVGTFMAYGQLNHGTEFFPEFEPDQATIAVRAPDGTDLDETDRIVRRIEAFLAANPNVDVFIAETGVSGGGDPLSGAQAAANQARISVDFPPHATKWQQGDKERVESTYATIERIRKQVATIAGARITIDKLAMGPPVGAPVAVEVSGDDFGEVGETAAQVRRDLATIAGVTDLNDDFRVGRPEMRMRIDRGAAKRVGASTRVVASTIRTAVAGTKASTLRDGEDEYDIKVELADEYKRDLQSILALYIPGRVDISPDTFAVPLSAVASYQLAGGSGSIRHIDQDLVVTIKGDVLDGFNENAVREKVSEYIAAKKVPGFKLRLGGANDEQQKSVAFLSRAFLIALFLIAIVLVTQFNSFSTPMIILGSVVLSLVGVLWGLIITATPFGIIMTGIGVISLAGVVVNNAIVLLDYVEQLKREGRSVFDALVEAGMVRFRPVMLTAVTTILGLVPMATGISVDFRNLKLVLGSQSAGMWGPMAVAVIFGLAFATLLTLVMVPTFYSILDDVGRLRSRVWTRITGASGKAVPAE